MKKILLTIPLLFMFCSASIATTSPSTKVQVVKQTKKAVKKKTVKRPPRILKYVSPPQEILSLEHVPLKLPISEDVIATLGQGKIKDAARMLRSEPASAKSLHLLRECQKTLNMNKKEYPDSDKHIFYQNIGIAYHNLFLFLKSNNIEQKNFYKKALKYYKKALKKSSPSESSEIGLLIAALMAVNGDQEGAQKQFLEIDTALLNNDFKDSEYLAAYFAAVGNVPEAIRNIKAAHSFKPDQTNIWLTISDDFYMLEGNEDFQNTRKELATVKPEKQDKKNKKSGTKKKRGLKPKKVKASSKNTVKN